MLFYFTFVDLVKFHEDSSHVEDDMALQHMLLYIHNII